MKLRLVILILIGLNFFWIPVLASSFVDQNQTDFDQGSYLATEYVPGQGVALSSFGQAIGFGWYDSQIRDLGPNPSNVDFGWIPTSPYGKELPDNQAIETSYIQNNLDMTGNLGLWHLNQGATQLLDSSGNGNHLNCTNCPIPSNDAVYYQGAGTTGSQEYYNLPSALSVQGRDEFSLAFWIRITSANARGAIWVEPVPGSLEPRFLVEVRNRRIRLRLRPGDTGRLTTVLTTDNRLDTSSWSHVVVNFNANTDIHSIYLNNVETSNNFSLNTFPSNPPFSNPTIFADLDSNNSYLEAQLDELAFFDRNLTIAEIQSMYMRGQNEVFFQVRFCDDNLCNSESFVGPDGTNGSFFTDTESFLNAPISYDLDSLAVDSFFQYRFYLINYDEDYLSYITQVGINADSNEPSISLQIKDAQDINPQNVCNLGTATSLNVSTCSYRVKIATSDANGYTLYVQTLRGLSNGQTEIQNANSGTAGGSQIDALTAGTEGYGVTIDPGQVTDGGLSLLPDFDGSGQAVGFDYSNPTPVLTVTGNNAPSNSDTINSSLFTHKLNISSDTNPGQYRQKVIYTVVPSF